MASGSLEQSILDAFEDDEDVSSDEHGHLAGVRCSGLFLSESRMAAGFWQGENFRR